MTTQPIQPKAPAPAPPPSGIECFVESPIGKLIVGILTPITRITVMKTKDATGKVVEKTPLDSLSYTVWAGIILTVVTVAIVRVVVMLTNM